MKIEVSTFQHEESHFFDYSRFFTTFRPKTPGLASKIGQVPALD
jgi:hypothetical protein